MKSTILFRLLIISLLSTSLFSCTETDIYIVRHAEKDTINASDPPLTEAGLQRAQDLAELLKDKNITKVYSTNFVRTRSTVNPVADQEGISTIIYDDIAQLQEMLSFGNKKNMLIAGHSNTILDIARMLDTSPLRQTIEDSDFDNLLIVTRTRFLFWDNNKLKETTYGIPTLPD